MGPVSSVRPSVLTLATSPQPSAGTAASSGAQATIATATQTAKAVQPAFGAGQGHGTAEKPVAVESYPVQTAKARAEAAQRAYMMASLAAGLNPLRVAKG